MITENEVMAYLNEKIGNDELKPSTKKYVSKLKALEDILNTQTDSLDDLQSKAKSLESDINRTRGAISILLELSADSEGLTKEADKTPNNTDNIVD